MQDKAKVSLSGFELQLVTDANIILTKNSIIKKAVDFFGQLSDGYKQEFLLTKLPAEILLQPAKISKGENYLGLPYVMLDYPRCFGKDDVFAIRTFFWWGNFFSITLHVKGIYKELYQKIIIDAIEQNNLNTAWINKNSAEWEHHLNDSYLPINSSVQAKSIQENTVLKIVSKIELKDWDLAEEFLQMHFKKYLTILLLSFPGDEIIL